MTEALCRVQPDGRVTVTETGLVELLYRGQNIAGMSCDDPRSQHEWALAARECDSPDQGPCHGEQETHAAPPSWLTPEPYASMDIVGWCLDRCTDDAQRQRVRDEIAEFEARGMIPAMRHMMYCVQTWRKAGVIWGVGRGSSVSSFVLHLIGINRINPMEHDLDFGEWLK